MNPYQKAFFAALIHFSASLTPAMEIEINPAPENVEADIASVNTVAEKYWSDICSANPENVFSLFDPGIFEGLSDEEVTALKTFWLSNYKTLATKQGDSYEVSSRKWEDPSVAPAAPKGWHWPVSPEYQFQIQTFKKMGEGREFLYLITDLITKKDGRFLVVRPVPTPEEAKKLIRKKE